MFGIAETLQERIDSLAASGAKRFDPLRFAYIEALHRRSLQKPETVARIIESKALEALLDLQTHFEKARAVVAEMVESISLTAPEQADHAQHLFKLGDFRKIQRWHKRIKENANKTSLASLASLTNQLIQSSIPDASNTTQLSLDDYLKFQENKVFCAINKKDAQGTRSESLKNGELKSFRLFKKTWAEIHAQGVVTRSIKELPENAGHLNTEMLATKSLSIMRDLSPEYLSNFVTYIDTLFRLEQLGYEL